MAEIREGEVAAADEDGWEPWPPRERWTAHELAGTYDGHEDPMGFLVSLSAREWALLARAATGLPDAEGYRPSDLVREIAQEMLATAADRAGGT